MIGVISLSSTANRAEYNTLKLAKTKKKSFKKEENPDQIDQYHLTRKTLAHAMSPNNSTEEQDLASSFQPNGPII